MNDECAAQPESIRRLMKNRKNENPPGGGLSPYPGGSRSGEGEEQQDSGNHAHPDLAFHDRTS